MLFRSVSQSRYWFHIEGLSLIDFEIDADNDLLASNDAAVDNLCEFEISLFNVLSDSEIDVDNDLLASNDAVVAGVPK